MENDTAGERCAMSERRKLLKLGLYAAYTAPALLAMTTQARALPFSGSPGSSGDENPGQGGGPGNPDRGTNDSNPGRGNGGGRG